MPLDTTVCREAVKTALAAVSDKTNQDAVLDAMVGAILDHIKTNGLVFGTAAGVTVGGASVPVTGNIL